MSSTASPYCSLVRSSLATARRDRGQDLPQPARRPEGGTGHLLPSAPGESRATPGLDHALGLQQALGFTLPGSRAGVAVVSPRSTPKESASEAEMNSPAKDQDLVEAWGTGYPTASRGCSRRTPSLPNPNRTPRLHRANRPAPIKRDSTTLKIEGRDWTPSSNNQQYILPRPELHRLTSRMSYTTTMMPRRLPLPLCPCLPLQWLDGRHTILSPNNSSTSLPPPAPTLSPQAPNSSSTSNTKPSTPSHHPHLSLSPTVLIPPPEKTPMRRSTIWQAAVLLLAAALLLASPQLPSNSGPMATPWQRATW